MHPKTLCNFNIIDHMLEGFALLCFASHHIPFINTESQNYKVLQLLKYKQNNLKSDTFCTHYISFAVACIYGEKSKFKREKNSSFQEAFLSRGTIEID